MSADNWAVCPRCRAFEQDRIARAIEDARAAYGVASPEDYEEMTLAANVPIDLGVLQTFREDYDIWGAEDGVVRVSYGAQCQKCGLTLKFHHDHILYPAETGD